MPDNSYFFNSKNCYIFPGAELWWKDSDNESMSSDSSSCDEDDATDLEIDMKNELEQNSYSTMDDSQLQSQSEYMFSTAADYSTIQSNGDGEIMDNDLNESTINKQYDNSISMTNQCDNFTFNQTIIHSNTTNIETTECISSSSINCSNYHLKRSADIALDYCDSDQVVCNSNGGFDDEIVCAQKRHKYSHSEQNRNQLNN